MKYLLLIVLLICGCGTAPGGEKNDEKPINVNIDGDQNQVNIDNEGPASNEQVNNNADEEDETADQDAVDCCLARGNSLDEDDKWSDGGDCYREAVKDFNLVCEGV